MNQNEIEKLIAEMPKVELLRRFPYVWNIEAGERVIDAFESGATTQREEDAKWMMRKGWRKGRSKSECKQFIAYISDKLTGGQGDLFSLEERRDIAEELYRWQEGGK